MVRVTNECERLECTNETREGQTYCDTHLEALGRAGWKLRPDGTRRRGSVLIGRGGQVKVNASYNPRMMALLSGEITVEDLDDDELAKGMCRNADGTWPKRMPDMVPKIMYDRMIKELFQRSDERLREGLLEAVESVVGICTDDDVDASTRLKAATWLFERLRGKVPDVVQVTQDRPFEVVLEKVHRGPRPDPEVVEGELEPEPEKAPSRRTSARRRGGVSSRP